MVGRSQIQLVRVFAEFEYFLPALVIRHIGVIVGVELGLKGQFLFMPAVRVGKPKLFADFSIKFIDVGLVDPGP